MVQVTGRGVTRGNGEQRRVLGLAAAERRVAPRAECAPGDRAVEPRRHAGDGGPARQVMPTLRHAAGGSFLHVSPGSYPDREWQAYPAVDPAEAALARQSATSRPACWSDARTQARAPGLAGPNAAMCQGALARPDEVGTS